MNKVIKENQLRDNAVEGVIQALTGGLDRIAAHSELIRYAEKGWITSDDHNIQADITRYRYGEPLKNKRFLFDLIYIVDKLKPNLAMIDMVFSASA